MNEETLSLIKAYFKKSSETLKGVKLLYENSIYSDAISRAYYAAFYSVSAVLMSKGLSFSSHSQVIGNFDKEFIKTGLIEKEISVYLHSLFDERQSGDYDLQYIINKEDAQENIKYAETVIIACKKYLTKIYKTEYSYWDLE